MSKPMRWEPQKLEITDHAWKRWRERGQKKPKRREQLKYKLTYMLNEKLFRGCEISNLCVYLHLGGNVRAVIRLGLGTWVCTTILNGLDDGDEGINGEKLFAYETAG